MAVEQTRRLANAGQRVALICYSHGLASTSSGSPPAGRAGSSPAASESFTASASGGVLRKAPRRTSAAKQASRFFEHDLPEQMLELATGLPDGQKFDAIVIDEAQDFADSWWEPVLAALRDPEAGGLYVFIDEGQRVFDRQGTRRCRWCR